MQQLCRKKFTESQVGIKHNDYKYQEREQSIITVGWEMSCNANSKYGIKELSTIFDSGMLLPYLCQRGVLAIVDSLDHGQNTSMANC